MKFLWTFTLLLLAAYLSAAPPTELTPTEGDPETNASAFNSELIRYRLFQMNGIIDVRYADEVENYLRAYLTYGKRDSERLLGNALIYFPIIEFHLELFNLPDELKYLPMIESNLTPYAVSTAGATGLWQLNDVIASMYGLEVQYYLDERRDPYKSTQVALKYLATLFKRFKSWELALAAYNCGPTRVMEAINATGSKDFWKIRDYLPKETSNFIPRFLAAQYLMKYHAYHGIFPYVEYPEMLNTKPISVYHGITFDEISRVTGVDYALIKRLNPEYTKQTVPKNHRGNYVSLPVNAIPRLSAYVNSKCLTDPHHGGAENLQYVVRSGDSLSKIARKMNCRVEEIKAWNNLSSSLLKVGQVLSIQKGGDTTTPRV